MAHSSHRPLPEVQAERPPFDAVDFVREQPPQLDWKRGGGSNDKKDLLNHDAFTACDASKFTAIDPAERIKEGKAAEIYKLMIGIIVPRPIAFVSSMDAEGRKNLAPFSWFQMLSQNPPLVMVSFAGKGKGDKDTAANIKATKGFVVNIISEPFVEAANFTSIDAPHEVNEWELSGLTEMPSTVVKPPRVGEAAVAMECELEHEYPLIADDGKRTGTVLFGRVKLFHVRSDLFIEGQGTATDIAKLMPVSRLGGISYGRTTRIYELERPSWAKVEEEEKSKSGAGQAQL